MYGILLGRREYMCLFIFLPPGIYCVVLKAEASISDGRMNWSMNLFEACMGEWSIKLF